jgi:hypothetical protein
MLVCAAAQVCAAPAASVRSRMLTNCGSAQRKRHRGNEHEEAAADLSFFDLHIAIL